MKRGGFLRFLAYAAVGAVGTAAQYLVLAALVSVAGLDAALASGIGAVAGAVVNYLLNHRYTFGGRASHRAAAPRFFAVAAVGVLLNGALMYGFVDKLDVHWLPAQCLTTACVLALTYTFNAVWSFRDRN